MALGQTLGMSLAVGEPLNLCYGKDRLKSFDTNLTLQTFLLYVSGQRIVLEGHWIFGPEVFKIRFILYWTTALEARVAVEIQLKMPKAT